MFYKTEDSISASCVTELRVVEEGQSGPSGSDWYRELNFARGMSPS